MLYRIVLITSAAWVLVTGILVAYLVGTSWLGAERLDQVSSHVAFTVELEAEKSALAAEDNAPDRPFLINHAGKLVELAYAGRPFSQASSNLLHSAAALLNQAATGNTTANATVLEQARTEALILVRRALGLQVGAYKVAFDHLLDTQHRQLWTTIALAVVIPLATLLSLLFFRRRVLRPLHDLQYLVGLLARKDYTAATVEEVEPLMAPLFDKYNRMVKRMRDLDEGHSKRENALQQEVDDATRALFLQQVALARADRMATLGDLTARLAHDLRNPLSGVIVALTNMREEVDSADHTERLSIAISELERTARLLDNIVNKSRMAPEHPERLQLSRVVNDLIKLLRYQLSPSISVRTNVPDNIYCRLPDSSFRHVVLNLVTNAAQAIGEHPGTIEIEGVIVEGRAELSISDDGAGFPQELLEAGVHEYASWREGGSGFGLATARRFVLAHGAQLRLLNKPQRGATVVLSLPVDDCDGDGDEMHAACNAHGGNDR